MTNPVIQFRCPDDLRALLGRFGADPGAQIREDEIVLESFVSHYSRALAGRFSLAEAAVIVDALNGHLFTPQLAASRCTLLEVEDSVSLDNTKHGRDGDILKTKLEGLTEFADFLLLQLSRRFWREQTGKENPEKLLKRIFRCAD